MNRESTTMFRDLPDIHIQRSKMDVPKNLKTTWSVGRMIPIYWRDVIPGSTCTMRMSAVMRMTTPLYPTMDNLYTDFMFFFVPYRLVWEHWAEFWGENPNAWYPTTTYVVPHLLTDTGHQFAAHSYGDYFGLPVGQEGLSVNALPFRALAKIWNDWFRSTPLQQEEPNTMSDADVYVNAANIYTGGFVRTVDKLHDVFTSALPTPERGPAVNLPLGSLAPVYSLATDVPGTPGTGTLDALKLKRGTNYTIGHHQLTAYAAAAGDTATAVAADSTVTPGTAGGVRPQNLWADLTGATATTVQNLREALAVQHFYERAALYGGRYTEILRGIYGVESPDGRLQRSEYLGGHRVVHNIQTVVQSSSTDAVSPQGNTGAYSHTVDSEEYFTKSFTEHGILLGVLVTRYKHSYQETVPKLFQQRNYTDYYLPQFEGIGQVPIKNKEVYYNESLTDNDDVFGYQEYGYEWRYDQDIVTATMRSSAAGSLDSWHYADTYSARPVLGNTWIREDYNAINRTLAVSTIDQLFGDFYFKPTWVLPMPVYSMPGMDRI